MAAPAQAWPSHDEKATLPPKAEVDNNTCDNDGDDILLDTYFDHSQKLDSSALDALLETTFDTSEDDASNVSASTITAGQWRPAHPETDTQRRPSTLMKMESFEDNHVQLKPSPDEPVFTASSSSLSSHTYGHGLPLPAHTPSSSQVMPAHMLPYQPQSVVHQPFNMPFSNPPPHTHYYPNPQAVAMPAMNPIYHDTTSQSPYHDYHSPDHVASRQGTADLMDYDNTIMEEDEAGANVDGEIVDPCYAQLLYRCLRDAPDHTMSLKQVYEWVQRHSQKARDSNGTGWQNSVRHNLSMNAAFERVTAASNHGTKKGSLWRLTERALAEGVISTTRYRKDPKRKPERRSSPALKRQISGAKGGQATRAASQYKKAMQARVSGMPVLHSIERHRRDIQRRQQSTFYTPTSMPASNRTTASPQLSWMPNGIPTSVTQHMSAPPSPYFLPPTESDAFSMIGNHSMSNPHTPNEVQVGFNEQPKAMASPPTSFGSPSRGFLMGFELAHLDHDTRGLFGNFDDFEPDTPSLEEFGTDGTTPSSMGRLSIEPMQS